MVASTELTKAAETAAHWAASTGSLRVASTVAR